MARKLTPQKSEGQTAVEYMLLLAVVVVIVLVGLRTYLPRAHQASDLYFNRAGTGILGKPNPCGDGHCNGPFENYESCPVDC